MSQVISFIFITCALLFTCLPTHGQFQSPRLLPFQGRLTEASGKPIPDGVRFVQFRILDAPSVGNIVWPGETHRVTINGGLINVVLGTKSPLDGLDFNRTLYLEMVAGAEGAAQISPNDPPLSPRQAILPVLFAQESAVSRDTQKLAGLLFGTNDPSAGIPGSRIVRGSIEAAQLSTNIQLSDPRTPSLVQGIIRTLPMVIDNQLNGPLADGGLQVKSDLELLRSLVDSQQWAGDTYKKYRDLLAIVEPGNWKIPPSGMVFIPGGEYELGNSYPTEGAADEIPVHKVTLSPFFMDKYEVTYALSQSVYNWALAHNYDSMNLDNYGSGDQSPVSNMLWYQAVRWCNARSEKEGLTPVYYTDEAHKSVYRQGNVDLLPTMVLWQANGYRLPTEAEWEASARGGLVGKRFPWGDASPNATNANFGNGSPSHKPVGSYPANGFGLFDIVGNVFEWCWDGHSSVYYQTLAALPQPVLNPRGPSNLDGRVIRGGSSGALGIELRCSYRNYMPPGNHTPYVGLRCVRSALGQ